MQQWLGMIADLAKIKITTGVTITVALGHFLFLQRFSWSVLPPVLGVFLLACGSATLNHIQEAEIDARMDRTRHRPIPTGRIGKDWALLIALLFLSAGAYVLAGIEVYTLTVLGLGALALVWYNLVYTYLKRVTAFAIVPGALIGAIPPVIGWVSAGGLVTDPGILGVAFFIFLWQIPHFWCLLLMTGQDYEQAGLPSLTRILTRAQLERITSIWMLSLAVAGIVLARRFHLAIPWLALTVVASLFLARVALGVLRGRGGPSIGRPSFLRINAYLLAMVVCLAGDALGRGASS
ncbi:MAG: protoheme IX farnesyltransferase [Planctomycetota bacterium]